MKKNIAIFLLTIVLNLGFASYYADFIKVGSGAEPLAKGETAENINPIYAPLYNDAIIGFSENIAFGFTRIRGLFPWDYQTGWFSDYWALVIPIPKVSGGIALSNFFFNNIVKEKEVVYIAEDSIVSDSIEYERHILDTDNSLKISLGKSLGDKLSLGLGAKAISLSMKYVSEYRGPQAFYAFDFSVLCKIKSFTIISVIKNIGEAVKYEGRFRSGIPGDTHTFHQKIDAAMPTEIRVGGGWEKSLFQKKKITVCMDIRKGIGESVFSSKYFTGLNLGGEIGIDERIFLRIGAIYEYFKTELQSHNLTYGLGIKIDFLKVDIGIINTPVVNKFALTFSGK